MKLFLFGSIAFLMFNLFLDRTLTKMTQSDCVNGIQSACEYIKTTQKLINDI